MNLKKLAFFIIGITIAFALVILALFLFKSSKLDFNLPIDTDIFANYGVLVGGIATAILTVLNIFLLIQTLSEQRRNFNTQQNNFNLEQKEQKTNFDKQQIESRFFELLKIHRENSNDIMIKEKAGKKIFLSLQREFYEAFKIVNVVNSARDEIIEEIDVINIAYLCFFFGAVGENSQRTIRESLKFYDKELPGFVDELLFLFTTYQKRIKTEGKFDYEPFEGHQSRLGHYFRQLFQLVKYIDDKPKDLLSYDDKYEYIKTLRAQLSTQEQVLLFFNSLSSLGKPWEKKAGIKENKKLITKYNLIKNIPNGYVEKISIKKYYDEVHYESDGKKSEVRKRLELYYRNH